MSAGFAGGDLISPGKIRKGSPLRDIVRQGT
jgi:hypothetical protein